MYADLSVQARQELGQEPVQEARFIVVNGIQLDVLNRRLRRGESSTNLTRKECDMLRVLMTCAGRPVSNRTLVNTIWHGPTARNVGHVRTLVRQLRKKIEDDPAHPRYVQTVSEVGYVFGPVSSAPTEQANSEI